MVKHIRFFLAVAVAVTCLFFAALAGAQQGITVSDVIIDKTEKTAVAARDQALAEAPKTAFRRLAEQSMSASALKSFHLPDDATLAGFVQDIEIKKEQISVNRYVGNFTVRFSAEAGGYIQAAGGKVLNDISAAKMAEKPTDAAPSSIPPTAAAGNDSRQDETVVLILPYFQNILHRKILWEDPNPWRETWKRGVTPPPGLRIAVPRGDIEDIALGSTDALWAGDDTVLKKTIAAYHADRAVVMLAEKTAAAVRVGVYVYADGALEEVDPVIVPLDGNDAAAGSEAFAAAAAAALPRLAATHVRLDTDVPEQPPSPPAVERVAVEAVMSYDDFSQWLEMQKRLSALSPPVAISILSLSKGGARFTLSTERAGGLEGLRDDLAAQGIRLSGDGGALPYTLALP